MFISNIHGIICHILRLVEREGTNKYVPIDIPWPRICDGKGSSNLARQKRETKKNNPENSGLNDPKIIRPNLNLDEVELRILKRGLKLLQLLKKYKEELKTDISFMYKIKNSGMVHGDWIQDDGHFQQQILVYSHGIIILTNLQVFLRNSLYKITNSTNVIFIK